MSKVCTKCGVEKDESEFGKDKSLKSGRRASCKECGALRARKYRQADPEKFRERYRAWRQANLEKDRERKRAYWQANLEEERERKRAYRQANRDKIREQERARRQADPEKLRERWRVYTQTLPDHRVKSMLRIKNPPQELIELKRVQIQIQRFTKEKEKNNA